MATIGNSGNGASYSPLRPWINTVPYQHGRIPFYWPVWDIANPSNFHKAEFSLLLGTRSALPLEPNPTTLVEMFFPDSLLDGWVASTKAYARSRLLPSRRREVTMTEVDGRRRR